MLSSLRRTGRRITRMLLCTALAASAATAAVGPAQPAFAAHTFTNGNARTALDAFINTYYFKENGLWHISKSNGGAANLWVAAYIREGLCVANENFGGAYRQLISDAFYGLERDASTTKTWTETIDGQTRTTTTTNWWTSDAWNDDLLWNVNAAICAYEQTGDRHMLDVAELHMRWMLATQIDNRPGFGDWGMWHNSFSIGDYKDISTTGQVPYIALALAKYFPNRTIRNNATGLDLTYRDYALRTYDWMRSFIRPDGSILNGSNGSMTGYYDNNHYMMNVGLINDSAAALYKETGNPAYISDAVRITDWARNRFTINYNNKQILWPQWETSNGGNHYQQWVDPDDGINTVAKGIMARGILHLVEHAGQTQYLQWMEDNAQTAWDNRHLADNLLYTNWQIPNTLPAGSASYGNYTGIDVMNRIIKVQNNPTILNAGFETNNPGTANPFAWTKNTFGNSANDTASFTEYKGTAAHSGSYILTHYKNAPYQVYTAQTLTGLRNGTYTLRAWARSTGGQVASYLAVKDYGGGTELTVDLRAIGTGGWQQVTIPDVNVTNGKATIGLYSNAGPNQWTNLDDVQLTPPPVISAPYTARNFSFEDNNAATPNPANWTKYNFGNAANDVASFAETKNSDARTGNYILAHYKNAPYQIYTSQTITGLTNGTYNLAAWVRTTGGQTASYMAIKDYGDTERTADMRGASASSWTLVSIVNVPVTNGKATIGFYSNAGANQWVNIDDINLARH